MECKYDVFISYSSKDYLDCKGEIIPGNVVSAVIEALQNNNISFWIDEKGNMTGKMFAHVIAENIRNSRIFLLICSFNSVESRWVDRELSVADLLGKHIIPLVCDDSYLDDRVVMFTAPLGHVKYNENPKKALGELISCIKAEKTEIVPPKTEIKHVRNKVMQDEHWGFADEFGKIVVPCKYNAVTNYYEGLACVESDKRKWGFVDLDGNEVIPCKWEDVGFFSDGLAYAEDAFGRIGFIDKKGRVVIPCQYSDVAPFHHGKTFVKDTKGTWHQIDKTGAIVE